MGIHANNRDARLMRIYCEGAWASDGGALITTNPWDETTEAEAHAAWDQGWTDENGGAVDLSCCALPRAGLPAPEINDPGRT